MQLQRPGGRLLILKRAPGLYKCIYSHIYNTHAMYVRKFMQIVILSETSFFTYLNKQALLRNHLRTFRY